MRILDSRPRSLKTPVELFGKSYCVALKIILKLLADRRTCARCGEHDGEYYKLSEMNQGENAPPLHPRCRCTIVASLDDGKQGRKLTGERAAQNRTRVPADMSYNDWKAIYIDKTRTFDEWRAAKDHSYKTDALTADKLPSKPSDGKTEFKFDIQRFGDEEKVKLNIKGFGEAYIPMAKLTKYALNPDKAPDKALVFEKALGYNLGNVDKLIQNVIDNINDYEMVEAPDLGFGRRFSVAMKLTGENGKTAKVLAAWILDNESNEFRLISIYVDKQRGVQWK